MLCLESNKLLEKAGEYNLYIAGNQLIEIDPELINKDFNRAIISLFKDLKKSTNPNTM